MADRPMGGDTGRFREKIELRENIRDLILSSGALAVGFTHAGEIDEIARHKYQHWIEAGEHAGMEYLKNHLPLRKSTESVLPGAKTVISVAYGYDDGASREDTLPEIASYALRNDYHEILREHLGKVLTEIKRLTGGEGRICIDSAPIDERYWAKRAGIGVTGRNGALIIPGYGSFVFLAEILLTAELPADTPASGSCLECGACVKICPGNAIHDDGTIDSRRCISYLTIEHRGEWNEEQKKVLLSVSTDFLYGCDLCMKVCPHNKDPHKKGVIESLQSRPDILNLSAEEVLDMTPEDFSTRFRGSPIKRCKLSGLRRNALFISSPLSSEGHGSQ